MYIGAKFHPTPPQKTEDVVHSVWPRQDGTLVSVISSEVNQLDGFEKAETSFQPSRNSNSSKEEPLDVSGFREELIEPQQANGGGTSNASEGDTSAISREDTELENDNDQSSEVSEPLDSSSDSETEKAADTHLPPPSPVPTPTLVASASANFASTQHRTLEKEDHEEENEKEINDSEVSSVVQSPLTCIRREDDPDFSSIADYTRSEIGIGLETNTSEEPPIELEETISDKLSQTSVEMTVLIDSADTPVMNSNQREKIGSTLDPTRSDSAAKNAELVVVLQKLLHQMESKWQEAERVMRHDYELEAERKERNWKVLTEKVIPRNSRCWSKESLESPRSKRQRN